MRGAGAMFETMCEACNAITRVEVKANVSGPPTGDVDIDPDLSSEAELTNYLLGFCPSCDAVFLLKDVTVVLGGEASYQRERVVLFPTQGGREPEGLPERIAGPYRSARACFKIAEYDAAAMMCRKALEALCKEKVAQGRDLQARLESLRSQGHVDDKLLAWAHELRMVGNDAAHNVDSGLTQEDARDALEFSEALLMYVYSLAARFVEFKRRRSKP